jgi:tetratricopeptide (TPR) repeat protein
MNNLGNALGTLGSREAGAEGSKRLEEAIAVLRHALEEGTRERVPLAWARIMINLGNALGTLGSREAGAEGSKRLEEAIAAYHQALEEGTRERVPLEWGRSMNNLGNALQTLGAREAGAEGSKRLEGAIAAYRQALEEWTRERVPLEWARIMINLANALQTLGTRQNNIELFKQALAVSEERAEGIEQLETAADGKPGWRTAAARGNQAYYALFARDFTNAFAAADRAHELAPDLLWIERSRAHALLFRGRTEEAKALYLAHMGKRLWEQMIAKDFADFKRVGLTNPKMGDIEAALGINQN